MVFKGGFTYWVACGFGSGLVPKAPGTAGTLVAIPLVLLLQVLGNVGYFVVTAAMFVLGIFVCHHAARVINDDDPGIVVWDEIVGYCAALIFVPVNPVTVILAFIVFRMLDIFKPWPISYFESRLSGGFGIMFDDLAAGLMTNFLLQFLILFSVIQV